MTIRVVIADDEPSARGKLRRLLRAEPDVELVAECSDGPASVAAIREHRPDAAFLDIQMPELDGVDAIASLPPDDRPQVIFVTAYDTHALRAFAVHASDYLLKPFDAARLHAVLHRVRRHHELQGRLDAQRLRPLLATFQDTGGGEPAAASGVRPARYAERLELRSIGHVDWIDVRDIEWIEASGNYVRLHTAAGSPLLREPLSRLIVRLDPTRFARVHRGAAVNLAAIVSMRPRASGDHRLTLRSGARVRLSRSFRAAVQRRLAERA